MSTATSIGVPLLLRRAAPRAALVGLLAWWWPSLTAGDGVAPDVLVAGEAPLVAESNPLLRHLRERGLGVAVAEWNTWCDIDAAAVTTPTIVVSFATEGECAASPGDAVRRVLDGLRRTATVVVVRSPLGASAAGVDEEVLAAYERGEIQLADPSRLLGTDGIERQPCQWWDDCEPDGQVTVREPDGTLTWAGMQRVGRVTAGALP